MMSRMIMEDELLAKAKLASQASKELALMTSDQKNQALLVISHTLHEKKPLILAANKKDLSKAEKKGMSSALMDRLMLNDERIEWMAQSLEKLVSLHDPIGDCLDEWDRPNKLHIEKIRVPLGVVGMIYEARPNVTADAAGLCLKTGNAVYLRGSGSALDTNRMLVSVIHQALARTDLPPDSIQLLEDVRHETADRFFRLNGLIDVLIPRGSRRLIQTAVEKSSIPVLETGAGNCHLYIDETADPDMAARIAVNAKTQRPSVCNAIETIVIQKQWFTKHGKALIDVLRKAGVACRIDKQAARDFPDLPQAGDEDWSAEYLDKIVAIKIVRNVDEAIIHINRFGTKHSEAIISESPENVSRFFQRVDAAVLYHNASTRFTDGGEFGFGAEIGISTQKLHVRGPMGLNALTTTKYIVKGAGQIRE